MDLKKRSEMNKEYMWDVSHIFETKEKFDVIISFFAKYYHRTSSKFEKFVYYTLELTKRSYIKRVIALPGQTVDIKNGRVYIDNEILEEEYYDDYDDSYDEE